jgi:phenylacetate-CoA ligase
MNEMERKYWDPKIELMSFEEIKILQERRLRQVVEYVYLRSPFYRKKFDKVGLKPNHIKILKDINKIPLSDKYEMRESAEFSVNEGKLPFSEFITVPEELVVTIHCTSGTTGTPFTAPLLEPEITSRGMIATGESAARQFWAAGLRPGDIIAHMWNLGGAMVGGGNHVIAKGACIPELYMTVIPCHVGNTEKVLRMMIDMNATAICCTPSYAAYMPQVAQKMDINLKTELKIKSIITGGEPGGVSVPGLRDKLKDLWGAEIFDMYGAPGVGLSYECESREGFHTQADSTLIQVVDPETGQELPYGELGSIVGTGLAPAAFPWLRFNTEDKGRMTEERCECGRTHPRLLSVPGRWDDVIKIKGFQLHPNAVEKVIVENQGCSGEFLIILDKDREGKDHVAIKIEHNLDVRNVKQLRDHVEHALRVLITLKADVEMVPEGTLDRYVMKKLRLIDNRSQDQKDKFDQASKLRSAKYFD